MKKLLGIMVLSLLLSSTAHSYLSKGTVDCGTILRLSKDNPMLTNGMMTAYVNGYITGRNYETNRNVGKGVSNDSIYYAVLKYCEDNPLKDNADAAKHIFQKIK